MLEQWNLHSRVHKLNHFPDIKAQCYVKRDDELGCGISGTKLRKYSSLVPYLLKQQCKHLIIIAGPQSNNLLSLLQIARELGFKITVFLLQPWTVELKGNFKLSSLFIEHDEIIWVSRQDWSIVDDKAQAYAKGLNDTYFIVNEGASVAPALPGAMSLASDILSNEQNLGIQFQHIFIDAGTGFAAIALLKGLAESGHQAMVHVLLLADEELIFNAKLKHWVGEVAIHYSCYIPTTAKAFGSVNQHIKAEVRRMAKEEGILADPIYAAKLFYESRRIIEQDLLQGNILIIHSGGTLTLPNFDY